MKIKNLTYHKIKKIYPKDMQYNRHVYRRLISFLYKGGYKTIDKYQLLTIIRGKFPVFTQPSNEEFPFENNNCITICPIMLSSRQYKSMRSRNVRKWEPIYDEYIGKFEGG